MFCPRCSQQQGSDEARFCSRCGFQLGVVKALLVAEEAPAAQGPKAPAHDPARRKKDLTVGASFMFLAVFLVVLVTNDLPPSSGGARLFSLFVAWLVLTLLINIAPLVRYFFGGQGDSRAVGLPAQKDRGGLTTQVGPAAGNPALPPPRATPVTDFDRPRVKTAEVVPPPSVTEQTTNLL